MGVWGDFDYVDASLNGVEFFTITDTAVFGRRQAIYEIPGAPAPKFADLGPLGFQDQLPMIVLGPDYAAQRNALITIFQTAGPHVLVHPQYGQIDVIFDGGVRVVHDDLQGSLVAFEARIIEVSGEDFIPVEDTAQSVELASDALASSMVAAPPFAATNDTNFLTRIGDIANNANRLQNRIAGQLSRADAVTNAIADFTDGLLALAATPDRLMAKITALNSNVLRLIDVTADIIDPTDRITINGARAAVGTASAGVVFDVGADDAFPPPASAQGELDQANLRGLNIGQNLSRISEAARQLSRLDLASSTQALTVQGVIVDALDRQVEQDFVLPDDVESKVYAVRAAISRHLTRVANDLQGTTVFVPADSVPLFLIAYKLFGSADESDQLAIRNQLDTPNFTLRGEPLEVSPSGA